MTALEIYKAHYEEECTRHEEYYSKYRWAARYIFDLTTYDGSLDELFVKTILEVCKVILEKRNYEYIEYDDNYPKFIQVCQMLKRYYWLDWGTSLRGAWFSEVRLGARGSDNAFWSRDILEEYSWWTFEDDGVVKHVLEAVPFTVENLVRLIEFMNEDEYLSSCSE